VIRRRHGKNFSKLPLLLRVKVSELKENMTKFILPLAVVFGLSIIAQAADPTPTPSPAPSASAGKTKHHHKKGAPKASPSPSAAAPKSS
jgi:hypothetical protein